MLASSKGGSGINKNIDNKFQEFYTEIKEKEFLKLIDKNKDLIEKLEKNKLYLKESKENLNTLLQENKSLKLRYETLILLLHKQGVNFNIKNRNLKLQEWDNLFFNKKNNSYYLTTKSDNEVYIINSRYNAVIEDIILQYQYSLVITRIYGDNIKINFRITGKRAD